MKQINEKNNNSYWFIFYRHGTNHLDYDVKFPNFMFCGEQ